MMDPGTNVAQIVALAVHRIKKSRAKERKWRVQSLYGYVTLVLGLPVVVR